MADVGGVVAALQSLASAYVAVADTWDNRDDLAWHCQRAAEVLERTGGAELPAKWKADVAELERLTELAAALMDRVVGSKVGWRKPWAFAKTSFQGVLRASSYKNKMLALATDIHAINKRLVGGIGTDLEDLSKVLNVASDEGKFWLAASGGTAAHAMSWDKFWTHAKGHVRDGWLGVSLPSPNPSIKEQHDLRAALCINGEVSIYRFRDVVAEVCGGDFPLRVAQLTNNVDAVPRTSIATMSISDRLLVVAQLDAFVTEDAANGGLVRRMFDTFKNKSPQELEQLIREDHSLFTEFKRWKRFWERFVAFWHISRVSPDVFSMIDFPGPKRARGFIVLGEQIDRANFQVSICENEEILSQERWDKARPRVYDSLRAWIPQVNSSTPVPPPVSADGTRPE